MIAKMKKQFSSFIRLPSGLNKSLSIEHQTTDSDNLELSRLATAEAFRIGQEMFDRKGGASAVLKNAIRLYRDSQHVK